VNRGVDRDLLGDHQGALRDYTAAIRVAPDNALAYTNRAAVRVEVGDKKGAIQDYQQAAKFYQQQGNSERYQFVTGKLKELQQ
jgi:tetratricopeptide (TPR) repeat protein